MKVIFFYWRYIKPYLFKFILAMVVVLPIGVMDGLIPWAIKPFFDGLTTGKSTIPVSYIPLLIIAFSTVQGGLGYISRILEGSVGQYLTMGIRMDAYHKLLNYDLQRLNKKDSGYVIVRLFNDPLRIQGFLLITTRTIISRLASILSVSVVMFMMNWKLALIAIGAILVLIIPMMEVRKRIYSFANAENKGASYIMTLLNSTVAGFKVIMSYNLQNEMARQFKQGHLRIFDRVMHIYRAQALLAPCIYIITALAIATIMYYGSHLILKGEMTPGALVAFITSLLMLYRPLRSFGDTVVTAQRQFTAMDRFVRMMRSRNIERPDTSHLPKMKPLQDKIEIKKLRFKYSTREKPVLQNINLTIERGKMVALVGRSGSGKTTLAELILGIYSLPGTQAEILFDGVSIRELNLESIRDQISYVNQDTFLFDGTFRENILLGKLDATEEEIRLAIKQAHLTEFIDSLPRGLDTEIGERGVLLSGGQRQRLAIARAFLKNAPILILDEATSSLDNESEAAVQKALDELMVDRTTLVIAHRFSTILSADKIVVLDDGHVVEEGTHQELLAKEGLYYQLFHAQKSGYIEVSRPHYPEQSVEAQTSIAEVLDDLPAEALI